MTAQDRPTLKSKFEQGDKPQGTDYADMVDSFVAIAETSAQSMSGNLQVPTIIATNVSAGTVYSNDVLVSGLVNAGAVSAQSVATSALTAANGQISVVSAQSVQTSALAFVAASGSAGIVNSLTVVSALVIVSAETQVTASPGAAGAVPASAQGYLEVSVKGTVVLVPYFVKPTI